MRHTQIGVVLFLSMTMLAITGPLVMGQDATGAAEETERALSVAVEKVVSDRAIQQRLNDILQARERYESIDVAVESGIVTLRGTAASDEDVQWITELAERTEGVVLVEDQTEVNEEVNLHGNWEVIRDSLAALWRDFLRRLPLLLAGILVLFGTALLAKLIAWTLTRIVANRSRLRTGLKDLIFQLTTIAVWIAGLMVTAVVVFPGMTPSRALTLLGVGSVAIGFAFKDIFENFFAGILILWRYPFDRGDFISNQDMVGCVEEITVRNTLIRRLDGELTVVPNAQLFTSPVDVLTSRPNRRVQIICGVAYGEDMDAARDVISQAVQHCGTVVDEHPVEVFAHEFADSSVNFEVSWWTGARPFDIRRSRDQVIASIKRALDSAGIEIPFPYRTLTFKHSVPLSTGPELFKGDEMTDTGPQS